MGLPIIPGAWRKVHLHSVGRSKASLAKATKQVDIDIHGKATTLSWAVGSSLKYLTPYRHVYDHHSSSSYLHESESGISVRRYIGLQKAQDGAQSNINENGMSGGEKHYDHATPCSGDMVGARMKWS